MAHDLVELIIRERERRLMRGGLGLRAVRGGRWRNGATQLPDPMSALDNFADSSRTSRGVREVPISGHLERSKTVCEGPSPEKPMHNAQGRPRKCCGGGGYLSTGNPSPKIDEAVFVGYRLNIGC